MGVVRNFIEIIGITTEEYLPRGIHGQRIQTSNNENIFIANKASDIKDIYQIMIDIKIKDTKEIQANKIKTIIIDCVKTLRIIYYNYDNMVKVLEETLPYNTFIEVEELTEIKDIQIYIADSYFELINRETLYSHNLYYIYVGYKEQDQDKYRYVEYSNGSINCVCYNTDIPPKEEDNVKIDVVKLEENFGLIDIDMEYL